MVNFYVDKIKNEAINEKTGKAWAIDDVPKLWKKKVEKRLDEDKKKVSKER